jgi:hypothetical protein
MGYPIQQCQDNWWIRPEPLTNGDVGGWFGTTPLSAIPKIPLQKGTGGHPHIKNARLACQNVGEQC